MKALVIGIVGESVFMKCDHFHQEGETIRVDNIYKEIGGKGFNQALTIHSLGGDVTFVCSLGSDSIKNSIVDDMNKLGINYKYFIDQEHGSPYATILTNKYGDNRVSVYSASKLKQDDLKEIYQEIDKAEYILLQLEIPYEINLSIAKYAKAKNKTVVLNPAPVMDITELLNYVDIITPNEIEVVTLFGENYQEVLLNKSFKTVVTRGSKTTLLIDNKIREFETLKVDAVDTTGAGDTFNGALVYKLLQKESIEDAIKYAQSCASKTVTYNYVLPGILALKK